MIVRRACSTHHNIIASSQLNGRKKQSRNREEEEKVRKRDITNKSEEIYIYFNFMLMFDLVFNAFLVHFHFLF